MKPSRLVALLCCAVCRYHFYEQFLSVEATCLQDHHKSTGQINFRGSRCDRVCVVVRCREAGELGRGTAAGCVHT
jgi:hypothetical protein